jgi:nucleoside-diphosphate-sugar epimerase
VGHPGPLTACARAVLLLADAAPLLFADIECEPEPEHAQAPGQTYWVADEKPYTTNEIYRTVAELLEVPVFQPRHIPAVSSDICLAIDKTLQSLGLYEMNFHVAAEMTRNIACSIGKAKAQLGYNPKIDLREGMRRSIEWCRAKGML